MNKRRTAIILEVIPLVSVWMAETAIWFPFHGKATNGIIMITTLLGFLGFVFFLIGRKLAGDDKLVRVLGILDIIATLAVIGTYGLAIISFAL